MKELNGTATITGPEMQDCINHWQVLDLLKAKGVPFAGHTITDAGQFTPHPDYEYTEHVDYDSHTITITWSKKL